MASLDLIRASQKKVNDLLAQQSGQIDTSLTQSQDLLDSERSKYSGNIGDILTQSGVSPLAVSGGRQIQSVNNAGIKRKTDQAIDQKRLEQKRRIYNLIFNNAYNQLVQSGADLNTANERARQLALDESELQFQAGQAEQGRNTQIAKTNLGIAGKGNITNMINSYSSDPYEQAVIQALSRTGVNALGSIAVAKSMKSNPASSSSSTQMAGAGGNADAAYDYYYPAPTRTAGIDGYGG